MINSLLSKPLLRHAFDVEVLDMIHLNELTSLTNKSFDFLITFSNRISAILSQKKYHVLKLNYFIKDKDVEYLLKHGFSINSGRKILAAEFIESIANIETEKLADYLKMTYSDYFL